MASRAPTRARALVAFAASVAVLLLGIGLAAERYPGGFDWVYTVMSALVSYLRAVPPSICA